MSSLSYVVGFDDFAFPHEHRGNVSIVGAVYSDRRLEGVLRTDIRRDGANATRNLTQIIQSSKYSDSIQLVMLQGIALAGFNVIDIQALHKMLGVPVLVVARREPDMTSIQSALLHHVVGGTKKWKLIVQAGPMEPVARVWVQRAGISLEDAEQVILKFAIHGNIPEPLRTAHLIASGIASGQSRGRT